jgi:hypothetical protein
MVMRALRTVVAGAALLPALLAGCVCGASREAGLYVTVEGGAPAPIATLSVVVTRVASGDAQTSNFGPPAGATEITLPTDLGLVLRTDRRGAHEGALNGDFEVCVTAQSAAGDPLSSGCTTATLTQGETTDVTVTLAYNVPDGGDAGADSSVASDADAGGGADAGTDAAPDSGAACGDGVREGAEACDGADLGGQDCVSIGLASGTLACDGSCAFDTTGCVGPPTVPVPRKPMNGSYVGSVHVAGSLRPAFAWEPSAVGGGAPITYELEYSTDPGFAGSTTAMTMFANHQPMSDLAASIAAPVGARYYWHVRACAGPCSAYSPTWYVNVGRSDRDFNGDGYADLLLGSPFNDTGGMDAGSVRLLLGGPGAAPDTTVDATFVGAVAGDHLGDAVAYAGDINADGFSDALVGASAAAGGAGEVRVFFGGSGVDTTPDAVLPGPAAGVAFGYALGGADVDADGFSDVLIGAWSYDGVGTNGGAVFIYMGGAGATLDTTADLQVDGLAAGNQFGFALASAGDVDGDGYHDVVVGANFATGTSTQSGAAYLFRGGPTGLASTPAATYSGSEAYARFGAAVTGIGDANGDGFADFVVGEPSSAGSASDTGRAYVFMGGSTVPATSVSTLSSLLTLDTYGGALSGAGDVNGDGYDDLLVGAKAAGTGGVAYLFLGGPGPSFNATSDGGVVGALGGDSFGQSVSGAGDLNADGFADVVVGAPGVDSGGMQIGRAYVFLGSTGPFDTAMDGTYTGAAAFDQLGVSVASHRASPPLPAAALAPALARGRRRFRARPWMRA